jgi:arylamine N-acetyltransferase
MVRVHTGQDLVVPARVDLHLPVRHDRRRYDLGVAIGIGSSPDRIDWGTVELKKRLEIYRIKPRDKTRTPMVLIKLADYWQIVWISMLNLKQLPHRRKAIPYWKSPPESRP